MLRLVRGLSVTDVFSALYGNRICEHGRIDITHYKPHSEKYVELPSGGRKVEAVRMGDTLHVLQFFAEQCTIILFIDV